MQNSEIVVNNISPGLPVSNVANDEIRQSVSRLIDHLGDTGKVCPRPWYWERFFILFKPRYEPCWLSSWWQTPIEEKKELLRKQIYYLAFRTNRYAEAFQFLQELDDENWLHECR